MSEAVSSIEPAGAGSPGAVDAHLAPTAPQSPSGADIAAIAGLSLLVFFFQIWAYGLWEPDEARYAEIAREMLQSGDWLTPHLNYVLYVEKPPLLYWLTAISFRLFGLNEFAARMPVALAATAGVFATFIFALRAFGRRHAILAAAILATTPLYAVLAQVLTTDMLLSTLVTIANFAFFLQWKEGGRWCWIAYVAMGLGMLAKGPVGAALPILSLLAFLIWKGELSAASLKFHARNFHPIAGLLLAVLIAAPWFVAMAMRVPDFVDFYFVGEHLRRVFDSDYSHGEPFYFYLPVLALGLMPWTLLVPLLTWREMPPNAARRFCISAAAVTIVAFSCASAKLIPYVLPAVAPLAVLIADGLVACAWPTPGARAALAPPDSRILREAGPMIAIVGAGVIVTGILAPNFRTHYVMAARQAIFAIGAILLVGGAAVTMTFLQRRPAAGLAGIVITIAIALTAGSWARLETESLRSYATLSRIIAAKEPAATIICYHRYVQSLAFYNRRRIILLGARTELNFGAKRDPQMRDWFMNNDEQMFKRWEQPGRVVIVLDALDLARMRERFGDFDVIASEGRKRAIVRRDRVARHGLTPFDGPAAFN